MYVKPTYCSTGIWKSKGADKHIMASLSVDTNEKLAVVVNTGGKRVSLFKLPYTHQSNEVRSLY